MYLLPISKLHGVSPTPQQLSQDIPLSIAHETILILLRDHSRGPVMSVLQNFFFGAAGKNYFALTLEMATFSFASEKL